MNYGEEKADEKKRNPISSILFRSGQMLKMATSCRCCSGAAVLSPPEHTHSLWLCSLRNRSRKETEKQFVFCTETILPLNVYVCVCLRCQIVNVRLKMKWNVSAIGVIRKKPTLKSWIISWTRANIPLPMERARAHTHKKWWRPMWKVLAEKCPAFSVLGFVDNG